MPAPQISVRTEVEKLQQDAVSRTETMRHIGVFIFMSTAEGDGWLLELTDQDALLVAKNGQAIDVEIDENEQTIEVNWSHRFAIRGKKFETTAYADNRVELHDKFPVASVSSAIRRIKKNFSSKVLESIHVG